ncbi:MAG: hypothetical protein MAG453_01155 [Calditrichaeota bacterium]|nr:hypothetical protein [Calditrichota bacterium]
MPRTSVRDEPRRDYLVIRVRGESGNPAVEAALEKEGVDVHAITVYATLDAPLDELTRAWLARRDPDLLVFTSGSTFLAFRRQWGEEADRMLRHARIVSIGPVTSALIRGHGYDVAVEAERHSVTGILSAVAEIDT